MELRSPGDAFWLAVVDCRVASLLAVTFLGLFGLGGFGRLNFLVPRSYPLRGNEEASPLGAFIELSRRVGTRALP